MENGRLQRSTRQWSSVSTLNACSKLGELMRSYLTEPEPEPDFCVRGIDMLLRHCHSSTGQLYSITCSSSLFFFRTEDVIFLRLPLNAKKVPGFV
ncbi:hypothetical protein C5167_001416 [Papaver somniferum]|uniref:Uncharacterized protein n=1 Tax=Papaver somniferum TaxID=3469 RepID=A0A4Y7KYM0_PAPSO|nr:hypothetical protein C5167_001416 [Papaver somniferum]